MRRKECLEPVRYDSNNVEVPLSWDDLKMNSVLRAAVLPPLLPMFPIHIDFSL
jgi:hypothetical protein